MEQPARERITLVEVLELTAPFSVFESIIQAAARRLEREGVRGLVGLRFYARPDSTEVGAVVTFADARQVMEHIHMISGWPEFKALLGVAKPVDVRVYGRLGEEAHAWLKTMNVVSKVFETPVAGFVR
ncbi:hypothetical protein D7Y13_40300 [Corallococcus praedator]|uniref:ABM domain-containing protein n=1 Tax=Corallococcus praedator TaxID=2316724 RepID=A0ABX9Q6V3_9BACT|nr:MULTISPECIES: hypothetical protein [Corallococcus]RKH09824.1 hypothetical protein D7X74_28760 [Corallococcus sp. CA047B]RKH25147.1 hypothetical protein D7X75_30635 [Corallococcus sp. CA031C]RKH89876.1 hypothetical protein D7Y13_40300 [Corallococcus praedator]